MDNEPTHPMQKIIDTMGSISRATRSQYHMTLGDFIEKLSDMEPDTKIDVEHPHCYRGYYEDLAFEAAEPEFGNTVGALRATLLDDVLDKKLTGYKGGDFLMDKKTPLWISKYGECSDLAVIDIEEKDGLVRFACKVLRDEG